MSVLPVVLFLIPFAAALVVAALGPWVRSLCRPVTLGAMGALALLCLYSVQQVAMTGPMRTYLGGWFPPLGIELLIDPLSAFMAAVVGVIGFAVLIAIGRPAAEELGRREIFFYSVSLLLVGGLMGMIVTHDLFNLFVHIEVVSLSAYALTAAGERRGAPQAALRYLLIGSLGASFYLLGVGFLYAATGTLNMSHAALRIGAADPQLVVVAASLMVVGLSVKMGLFPLHEWMPAAYASCPTAGACLMAPLVTKVSAYALIRVLFWVFPLEVLYEQKELLQLISWSGAIAVVVGAIMALLQNDIFRLFAYSSVSQMGIVALGIGLANTPSLTGGILHMANDALMKGTLFLGACTISTRYGVRRLDQLWRLGGRAPWLSAAITLSGLSLVGFPPMCGFYGKWYVLQGALESGQILQFVAVIIGSLASAAYVVRFMEALYFPLTAVADELREDPGPTPTLLVPCLVMGAGVLILGLVTKPLIATVINPALPLGL